MVQGVDNLTAIAGRITGIRPHPSLDGYDVLRIDLDHAAAVPGKADLLGPLRGQPVDVTVARALAEGVQPGARLRCRAKRTMDGAMCEKDPAPGTFAIE